MNIDVIVPGPMEYKETDRTIIKSNITYINSNNEVFYINLGFTWEFIHDIFHLSGNVDYDEVIRQNEKLFANWILIYLEIDGTTEKNPVITNKYFEWASNIKQGYDKPRSSKSNYVNAYLLGEGIDNSIFVIPRCKCCDRKYAVCKILEQYSSINPTHCSAPKISHLLKCLSCNSDYEYTLMDSNTGII